MHPRPEPHSAQPPAIVLITIAAAAGIATDRWLDLPPALWTTVIACSLLAWRVTVVGAGQKLQLSSLLVLAAWIGAGGLWHHIWWNIRPASDISRYASMAPAPAILQVRLTGEPRLIASSPAGPLWAAGSTPQLVIPARVAGIRNGTGMIPCSGNIEMLLRDHWSGCEGGDLVEVCGTLQELETPGNPGEPDRLAAGRGEHRTTRVLIRSASAMRLVRRNWNPFAGWRAWLRHRLDNAIHQYVAPGQSALASAILLGNRSQVSPDERQQFLLTGTVHILAISGLHVGMMAAGMYLLLRIGLLGRRTSHALVIAVVAIFAWLVEFSPPVTRAACLIALYSTGRISGRWGRPSGLLGACGLAVLAACPSSLFTAGAQLSFLAVSALLVERRSAAAMPPMDPLERLIERTRAEPVRLWNRFRRGFRRSALASGLIWMTGAPLVAHHFHLFTPVALAVNPLVILPMSGALLGGMLVMLFSGWFPLLAVPGGWLCSGSLWVIQWLVDLGTAVSLHRPWVAGPSGTAVAVWLLACVWLVLATHPRRTLRRLVAAFLLWLVLGWWLPAMIYRHYDAVPERSLECTFVDVGHGSATLVRFPNGRNLLFDAGSLGSPGRATRGISSTLWSMGVSRIDHLVVSHSDTDHFNAVPGICERFPVGCVWLTPQTLVDQIESVVFLRSELDRLGVPVQVLAAGDSLPVCPGLSVDVLAPEPGFQGGTDNAHSAVVLVRTGDSALLLTGDIEAPGLDRVRERAPQLSAGLLLAAAPHHGSLSSRPADFCAWSRPDIVVVSADRRRFNAPARQIWNQLVPVALATPDTGAVQVRLAEGQCLLRTWRVRGWKCWWSPASPPAVR